MPYAAHDQKNQPMATTTAPPRTKARLGSHSPNTSRKPWTRTGSSIPDKDRPNPKTNPEARAATNWSNSVHPPRPRRIVTATTPDQGTSRPPPPSGESRARPRTPWPLVQPEPMRDPKPTSRPAPIISGQAAMIGTAGHCPNDPGRAGPNISPNDKSGVRSDADALSQPPDDAADAGDPAVKQKQHRGRQPISMPPQSEGIRLMSPRIGAEDVVERIDQLRDLRPSGGRKFACRRGVSRRCCLPKHASCCERVG